ncbi:MAG: glycine cleavage system protein GcvH [Verrucomicrobiota bacterium]|nr:glycine cleavage system protein GcvH [Verrucomicrobiota bacterium]
MSNIPEELKYTKSHEWVRVEDGMVTIGITDHAQEELTDIVYVELPEVGRKLAKGEQCAVVESVKTASDIYTPLEGEVLEINTALESAPELVNEDPYERGWFFKFKPAESLAPSALLDSSSYAAEIGET